MSNSADSDQISIEAAYKAMCSFFYNVTNLFTNIMTASGRNHNSSSNFGVHQHHRLELGNDYSEEEDDFTFGPSSGTLASQLLTLDQQIRVKNFLCEIFELNKSLMLNESLKVAQQASSTVLIFLEAMERGKLTFEQRYPHGLS